MVGDAGNGEEALELIGRIEPDIAVVDINMPGINGIKLIQLLKERGSTRRSWCFRPTGEFSMRSMRWNYGAYAYLLKPINVEENVKKDNEGTPWSSIYRERTARRCRRSMGRSFRIWEERLSQVLERKAFGGGGKAGGGSHAAEASWRGVPDCTDQASAMDGGMEGNGMARDILSAFREKFILFAEQNG